MVNHTLLISSIIMTIVHAANIPDLSWYSLFVMHGCVTSILNHGMTSQTIQLYDRTTMWASAFIELYMCVRLRYIVPGCVIIAAAGAYLSSKKKRNSGISHSCACVDNSCSCATINA